MDAIIQALKQSGFIQGGVSSTDASNLGDVYNDTMRIMALARAYMSHGHLSAKVDPLELDEVFAEMDLGKKYGHTSKAGNILCDYKHWGLTDADLDRTFYIDVPQLAGLLQKKKEWTLREIDDAFKKAYCSNIGVEYMHI